MRKRRGRGEGSIFQRADNRWSGSVTIGTTATGARRRKAVYGATKREVQDKIAALLAKRAAGTLDATPGKLTVAQYLEAWLRDSAKPSLKGSTFDSYSDLVRLHIAPEIGGVKLVALSPLHVRGMLAKMEAAGLSPRRRQFARAVLRRAVAVAVKDGLVPRNVVDAVEGPRVPKHEITPLDGTQAVALLKAVEASPLKAVFVLAVGTGMRLGEILGLQWGDVDLKAGTLSVRRSLRWKRKEWSIEEPKTARSRRKIDLPAVATEALQETRVAAMAGGRIGFPWIFCEDDGTPVSRWAVRSAYGRVLKAAGLPTIRFHDLRHTSASLMLANGTHPKVVQERLGHARISTTLDVYSHVMPGMQREAADSLNSVLTENGCQLAVKPGSEASAG